MVDWLSRLMAYSLAFPLPMSRPFAILEKRLSTDYQINKYNCMGLLEDSL
jgi:hypothetical protein